MNSACRLHIYEPLGWWRGDLLTLAGRLRAITALGEFVHNFAVSCNNHLSAVLVSSKLFQNALFPQTKDPAGRLQQRNCWFCLCGRGVCRQQAAGKGD